MKNRLICLMFTTLLMIGCNYQNDSKILDDVTSSNSSIEPNQNDSDNELNESDANDFNEVDPTLKDLDLFSLWDIFFSNFVVQIQTENGAFDTRVDYENLHILNSTNNKLYSHLVASIEQKMSKIQLSNQTDDFKVAFYINAYNYSAIRVINKNYIRSNGSKLKSIRNLSNSRFNKYEIFSRRFINISGQKKSLDDLEKVEVKKLLTTSSGQIDSRFHFAVICASGGCPVTLNRAYREESLDQDLTFVTTQGLQRPRILKIEGNNLFLTKIISDWYKSDFISDSGSIEKFLNNYGVSDASGRVKKLSYDWNLNILEEKRETPTLSELGTPESLRTIESDILDSEVLETELGLVDSTCEDIKKYELITKCTEAVSSNVTIDELQVCIYKKKKSDNTYRIKHSMLIDGVEDKFSHKFKSEVSEFETVDFKSFLGLKKKKNVSYSLIGGTYNFEEARNNQVTLSASCVNIK